MGDGFGIMRIEKRHKSDVSGIQKENNRESKNLIASDIDWSRTDDNFYYHFSDNWHETINEKLKEFGAKARKDSVVMLDAVYTLSPQSAERLARDCQGTERDYVKEYFDDCLEFYKKEFGKDTIINAVIHKDETSPHLHITSVPVYRDEQGKGHLSAKVLCGGIMQYRERQDRFYEEVAEKYGLDRGERTQEKAPEEQRKHLTVLEYKAQQEQEKLQELEWKKEEVEEKVEVAESIVDAAKANADSMQKLANKEAEEVIRDANEKANEEAEEIIRNANEIANNTMADAQKKAKAVRELYEEAKDSSEAFWKWAENYRMQELERENKELKARIRPLEAFKQKTIEFISFMEKRFELPQKIADKIDSLLGREKEIDRDDDFEWDR